MRRKLYFPNLGILLLLLCCAKFIASHNLPPSFRQISFHLLCVCSDQVDDFKGHPRASSVVLRYRLTRSPCSIPPVHRKARTKTVHLPPTLQAFPSTRCFPTCSLQQKSLRCRYTSGLKSQSRICTRETWQSILQ